ncbi:MAG: isochorismatase family protein [Alphaproteobacteria bacterium]|nr:isochorismatase family protein [Alphaproteobacteria bacterium]
MPDLRQQISYVSNFLRPINLTKQTFKYKGNAALFVIDVQKIFCDPKSFFGNKETKTVSKRIQSIVHKFRDAGVPVYAIYFSERNKEISEIDFYEFKPESGDVLIAKNEKSAFSATNSNIKEILKKNGIKSLLACGFNRSACVKYTITDARKNGFPVCLLEDLTGNDSYFKTNKVIDPLKKLRELKKMQQEGIIIEQSSNVLKSIHKYNMSTVPTI